METIKEVLKQNHNSKTKAEMAEMMKNLQALISPEEYAKISAFKPEDLPTLTKKEILDVIEDFQTEYKVEWEDAAANNAEAFMRFVTGMNAIMAKDEDSFDAQAASDSNFAAELGSIDFEKLIGGPLNACVTAQTNASLATVNFIQAVGFDDDNKLRMVDFSHTKKKKNPNFGKTAGEDGVPDDADVTTEYFEEKVNLAVPFISVLSVPSLRIETCDIDFNVKLNSVYSKDVSSSFGIDASVQGGWGPVKFKVSASYKRSSSTGIKVEKEYSMGVKVRATNDEMPAGLEKVLGILAE